MAFRRRRRQPIGGGLGLMLVGFVVMWPVLYWLADFAAKLGHGTPWWVARGLLLVGAAMFAAGWVLVGAGLHRSARRGAALAAALYLVTGLALASGGWSGVLLWPIQATYLLRWLGCQVHLWSGCLPH